MLLASRLMLQLCSNYQRTKVPERQQWKRFAGDSPLKIGNPPNVLRLTESP